MNRADCDICSGTGHSFGKACACDAGAVAGCEACFGTGISWGMRCPCIDAPRPHLGDSIDTPLFQAVFRETFGQQIGGYALGHIASFVNKWVLLMHSGDVANKEWIDKTDWIQTDFQQNRFPLAKLGQHRADIVRDEVARLRSILPADSADTTRLEWVLPIICGNDEALADARTMALARALIAGYKGRDLVDHAMSETKGKTS
jgi:hypothetical protein